MFLKCDFQKQAHIAGSDIWGGHLSLTFFLPQNNWLLSGNLRRERLFYHMLLSSRSFPPIESSKARNQWNISWNNNNLSSISVNHPILANAHPHRWSNFFALICMLYIGGYYAMWPFDKRGKMDIKQGSSRALLRAGAGDKVSRLSPMHFAGPCVLCESIHLLTHRVELREGRLSKRCLAASATLREPTNTPWWRSTCSITTDSMNPPFWFVTGSWNWSKLSDNYS